VAKVLAQVHNLLQVLVLVLVEVQMQLPLQVAAMVGHSQRVICPPNNKMATAPKHRARWGVNCMSDLFSGIWP